MITNCTEIKTPIMFDISKSQLWNCLNGNKILDSCRKEDLVGRSLAGLPVSGADAGIDLPRPRVGY